MVKIKNLGVILEHTGLEFENQAVLNPSCITAGGITHMFYRAVRQGNFSSIGYCQIKDGQVINRLDHPIIQPEYYYEKHGVEDPRIVEVEGVYYLIYTAYDGNNVHAAYATSIDLVHFEKQGVISPSITYAEAADLFQRPNLPEKYYWYETHYEQARGQNVLLWEKDVFLFPKKFNNNFLLIHRLMPGIQLIEFRDFSQLRIEYWKQYLQKIDEHIVLNPKYWFESRKIGGGCPPIETPDGWLLIYHGVEDNPSGKIYHAAAALLDLHDPRKVIGRLKEPLFSPAEPWEKSGDVDNVVFPTGATVQDNELTVYYGAADKRIAAKSMLLSELLEELKNNPPD